MSMRDELVREFSRKAGGNGVDAEYWAGRILRIIECALAQARREQRKEDARTLKLMANVAVSGVGMGDPRAVLQYAAEFIQAAEEN